jgi:endonuclease IV
MNNLSIVEINMQLQAVTPQTLESIAACTEYGSKLAGWIAYTGLAKAQAKRELLQKKGEALADILNRNDKLSPSIVKEWVSAKTMNEDYSFELADRTNAAATHQLDLVRSILSALKTEMQSINFYNQ